MIQPQIIEDLRGLDTDFCSFKTSKLFMGIHIYANKKRCLTFFVRGCGIFVTVAVVRVTKSHVAHTGLKLTM